jgi:sulfur carrier protein
MIIEVNGNPREVDEGSTLIALIEAVAGTTRGSAAAVDGEVVPRGDWARFRLGPAHRIEIITAVQGG